MVVGRLIVPPHQPALLKTEMVKIANVVRIAAAPSVTTAGL